MEERKMDEADIDDFHRFLAENLKDPEFRREWGAIQPEYEAMSALIGARAERNLTQAQLAELSGIRQSNISRIESGRCSPTIATLQRLAMAMGKRLHIEFI